LWLIRAQHNYATGWTAQGSIPGRGRTFHSSSHVQTGLWCLLFNMYWRSLSRLKRLGREVNHLSPSKQRLRMGGAMPLLPIHAFTVSTGKNIMPFIGWTYKIIHRALTSKAGVSKSMSSLTDTLREGVTITYLTDNKGFTNTNAKCKRMHPGALWGGNIDSHGQSEESTKVSGKFVPRLKFYPGIFENTNPVWPTAGTV
jgi:hypothetical protein